MVCAYFSWFGLGFYATEQIRATRAIAKIILDEELYLSKYVHLSSVLI